MKFPKPFPASFREIVVWFFRPVFSLRIVEPFDEIENSPSLSSGRHYLLDVVFFRLLDVVGFSQHF